MSAAVSLAPSINTIDEPSNRALLEALTGYMFSHGVLVTKARTVKSPVLRSVYWDGANGLRDRIERRVRLLQDSGCLLHVGMVAPS